MWFRPMRNDSSDPSFLDAVRVRDGHSAYLESEIEITCFIYRRNAMRFGSLVFDAVLNVIGLIHCFYYWCCTMSLCSPPRALLLLTV